MTHGLQKLVLKSNIPYMKDLHCFIVDQSLSNYRLLVGKAVLPSLQFLLCLPLLQYKKTLFFLVGLAFSSSHSYSVAGVNTREGPESEARDYKEKKETGLRF